jgi:3-hydroxymyristoyl/3-hydroxydecanoyl-(acyl carrier protein) dehydratase
MRCAPIVRAVAAEAGCVTLQLDVPADLACFRGHYPGFPVLPGVVQIDWVMQLAVAHLRCGQPSATDFRIKFKRVIAPGSRVTLMLCHDECRRRLAFVYRTGELIASEGRVVLSAA